MTDFHGDDVAAQRALGDKDAPPRKGWHRRLYDWVLHWAETPYGTPALAIIAFAESSFFPVPPDPLLMALALGRRTSAMRFALVCTAASVVGGLAGYAIGRYGMDLIGRPLIEAYGYQDTAEKLTRTFTEHGFWAVLVAAVTPIPYKVFTITSGACALSLHTFILASVLGRGLRFFVLGILIHVFGEPIRKFIDRYFNVLSVVFVVLLVGGFLVVKVLW